MDIQLKDFFKASLLSTDQQERYTCEYVQSTLNQHKASFLLIFQMKHLIKQRLVLIKQYGVETINLGSLSDYEPLPKTNQGLADAITDIKLCLENIQKHIKQIHRLGANIDNLDSGQLRWKSRLDDQNIELLWSYGSEDLTHWKLENEDSECMSFLTFPDTCEK